jgi:hypothetical protein
MTWREIEERVDARAPNSASMRLISRKRSTKPACIVVVRAAVYEKAKWKTGDQVGVAIGIEGDDYRIRLKRNSKKPIAKIRVLPKGGFTVDVGHIEELGSTPQTSAATEAKLIDNDTIEIVVPDWQAEDDAEQEPPPARLDSAERKAPAKIQRGPAGLGLELHGVTIDLTVDEESVTYAGKTIDVTTNQAAMLAACLRGLPNVIDRNFMRRQLFAAKSMTEGDALLDFVAQDLPKAMASIGLTFKIIKGQGFALAKS